MACKLTLSLLSEGTAGDDIGNDWRYTLQARVFSGALTGEGEVRVPVHKLESGATQPPPGPPEPLVLAAAESGAEILVDLRLIATEVDPLKNDTGEKAVSFSMRCPESGQPPVVEERELTVGVTEEPSQLGTAIFRLGLRLALEAD